MHIIRARHLGMCFGVTEAIAQALSAADRAPLTILGQLVHNDTVLADLRARGVRTCTEVDDVRTSAVMVTAHGASRHRLAELQLRGLEVLNATCPLVRAAHRAIAMLVADGRHPVIVGQAHHAEVRGMTEDLAVYDVVLTEADVDHLSARPRFGIAAQTTQPVERVERLTARLRARFPAADVAVANTVCVPTRLRQQSAEDLAAVSDVVLVIGGAASNNTKELAATCRRHCSRVHHVQTAADVRREWFDRARVVGITAGTSTPARVIDEVEQRVLELRAEMAAA
jgi:4-hydroxy-3-methylbut-2-enyl diphosphate reductase